MSGRVCEKHERWCPDGVCPYCVEVAPTPSFFDGWGEMPLAADAITSPPLPQWPQALAFIPPQFRFVDAITGKPKPLIGKHWPALDRDACALCGKSGTEIAANPTSDCL